ncbi:hypothetical protein BFP72_06930 [Reichenbachiella sp. 5M10]|nr:hypothetical protein BFP72_06930 [Reichenbachiella sp. 5M10]
MAQGQFDDQGDVQDAEIVIEKDRQIELQKEVKLYEFIKWKPETQTYEPVNPGEFQVFEYDLADEPQTFKSAKTEVQKKESAYHQYLKVGAGNYWSPLVDLSLVSPGDPNQTVGLNYKHLSYKTGDVDAENSASSLNEISVYGAKVWERVKTTGIVSFKSDVNYYYGYPEGTVVDRQDIKKANRFISAQVGVEDNNLKDQWDYSLIAGFRGFYDNYDNAESTLDVEGTIGFSDDLMLEASLHTSNYEQAQPSARSLFRVQPYYNFALNGVKIKGGVSLSIQSDDAPDLGQIKVFPYLMASYDLTEDYEVYMSLDGGYDFNTLYDFSDKVPYLNPLTSAINTDRVVDVDLGVRGDVTDKWYAGINVAYQGLKYLPMYINDLTDQSHIDVIYDTELTNVFSVGLNSQYFLNKNHSIELAFLYNSYSGGQYETAYHLPTTEMTLSGEHLFVEKLTLQWQYGLMAGITAYDAVTDADVDLSAISRLDLTLHYQVKERLGAFISSDNTIGKSYSRYLYYPQRGIQIKGGITYRF